MKKLVIILFFLGCEWTINSSLNTEIEDPFAGLYTSDTKPDQKIKLTDRYEWGETCECEIKEMATDTKSNVH